MPLSVYTGPLDREALKQLGPSTYLVFFSGKKADGSGQLWCPDCRDALPAVEAGFNEPGSPQGYYVYADYAPWKDKRPGHLHTFRSKFNVQCVPTIARFENVS